MILMILKNKYQLTFPFFTTVSATKEEKGNKYKGGDWYVRRRFVGPNLKVYPVDWRGRIFALFFFVALGIFFAISFIKQPSAWVFLITLFLIVIPFQCVAYIKTYRPKK